MKIEEPGAEADPSREDVIDEDGGPPGLRRADLDGDAEVPGVAHQEHRGGVAEDVGQALQPRLQLQPRIGGGQFGRHAQPVAGGVQVDLR